MIQVETWTYYLFDFDESFHPSVKFEDNQRVLIHRKVKDYNKLKNEDFDYSCYYLLEYIKCGKISRKMVQLMLQQAQMHCK